jgi:hypothetical protein
LFLSLFFFLSLCLVLSFSFSPSFFLFLSFSTQSFQMCNGWLCCVFIPQVSPTNLGHEVCYLESDFPPSKCRSSFLN